MSIVSVLILVVIAISIVWAFKTGYVKALSEGYVFSFAYENFLDSCEGMDKEDIVLLDEDVRQEIMKYVDDPKQERKLRRRKKWASFWEYPLDSQWAWGKSLNLKG